ncbi:helix-turn-helix domain-containing protein [Dokdonella sp.]|jgi:MerR family transcriptional regulator, mercuric resistance operon regulatory protein|uniref:MerR family transcriptional regulator n=1 Tax=Dokdonella sp. TaxID=2291710 RepID=UPI0035271DC0
MEKSIEALSRGALASRSGVNSETIRYYENIGLMPDPSRSSGGHRLYKQEHVKRLSFIRRTRELGFTLKEIGGLLTLVDGGDYTCAEVRDRTLSHLNDVTRKIRDLQKMQRTLKSISSKCDGGLVPECPIVDALYVP